MIFKHTEPIIRLSFFVGILIVMAIWELVNPRRKLSISKRKRWVSNLSIVLIDTLILRLIFPAAAVGVALYASEKNLGLFHLVKMDYWLAVFLSVVILDFVIYLQHILFHAIPILWRVHRMHHIDLDFDVTTGVRFHPIEILISLFIKFAAILLLGAPVLGVIIFEVVLNGVTMFNHSNIHMPLFIDKIIRRIIVTPDMHRVHHSDRPRETNSNFGFSFSVWDRFFRTYKDQPDLGHEKMTIGIKDLREEKFCANFFGMLWVPFLKRKTDNYNQYFE